MKKTKLMFSLLVSMIILFITAGISNAMTISYDEIPDTVKSGEEFNVTFIISEKVTSFAGHIEYNPEEITFDAKSSDNALTINPQYAEGDLAFMYASTGEGGDTIVIKAKSSEVTEEKTIKIKATALEAVTPQQPGGETFVDEEIEIKVTPTDKKDVVDEELTVSATTVKLTVGKSQVIKATGKGTITWKTSNSNIATVDENGKITGVKAGEAIITVMDESGKSKEIKVEVKEAPTQLAKTGESEILALVICGLILIATIIGIRIKKINKLFVMLPILIGLTFAGNSSEAAVSNGAEIIDSGNSYAYVGIIEDTFFLGDNAKAIGISVNSAYRQRDSKITQANLNSVLNELGLDENSTYTVNSNECIATGDKLTSNGEEYTIIVYGDAWKEDGKLCGPADYGVIRDDFCRTATYTITGEQKIAVDLDLDKRLSVFDISRIIWKYVGKDSDISGGTLISKDPFKSDDAVRIGTERYATLQAAMDEANSGDTILLTKDINWDKPRETFLNIGNSKENITLDLAGHNITLSATGSNFIDVSGEITISNSSNTIGKITINEDVTTNLGSLKTFYVHDEGNLTLGEKVQIDSSGVAVYLSGDESVLNINGATIQTKLGGGQTAATSAIFACEVEGEKSGTINFNNGSIIMNESRTGALINGGKNVNINAGTFEYSGTTALQNIKNLCIGLESATATSTIPMIEQKVKNDTTSTISNVENLTFNSGIIKLNPSDANITTYEDEQYENGSDRAQCVIGNTTNIVSADGYELVLDQKDNVWSLYLSEAATPLEPVG